MTYFSLPISSTRNPEVGSALVGSVTSAGKALLLRNGAARVAEIDRAQRLRTAENSFGRINALCADVSRRIPPGSATRKSAPPGSGLCATNRYLSRNPLLHSQRIGGAMGCYRQEPLTASLGPVAEWCVAANLLPVIQMGGDCEPRRESFVKLLESRSRQRRVRRRCRTKRTDERRGRIHAVQYGTPT